MAGAQIGETMQVDSPTQSRLAAEVDDTATDAGDSADGSEDNCALDFHERADEMDSVLEGEFIEPGISYEKFSERFYETWGCDLFTGDEFKEYYHLRFWPDLDARHDCFESSYLL